jgi:DNA-3-methyladenine glycosylase I
MAEASVDASESALSRRCLWAEGSEAMRDYHDREWGVPSHDDTHLFEMLVLEGAQAGLSWSTILAKRAAYRRAFDGFDPRRVAAYGEERVEALMADPGIVRNGRKIRSAIANAGAFIAVAEASGDFAAYLWAWVDGRPEVHRPATLADVPSHTELSERLSKDLRRRGFSFVGPGIVYAYAQAVGLVDDHLVGCPFKRSR